MRKSARPILPALAAGACGLAVAPAQALELGDIRVDSALGQPLRASIAYALAPNEQMYDFCIFLAPGRTVNGVPGVSNVRVTVTDTAIVLNGRLPIREPLLAVQLSVNCPYSANLARSYTLMVDPPLPNEGERAALSTERPPMSPVQTATVTASDVRVAPPPPAATSPAPRRTTRRPRDESPIATSTQYLVQPGDSLSQIVARIEDRSIALWPAVNAIFNPNPHAFLDNDPNLLKAGSWLDIPDLTGSAVANGASATTVMPPVAEAQSEAPAASAYPGATLYETPAEPSAASLETTPAATEPAPMVEESLPAAEIPPAEAMPPGAETVEPSELMVDTAPLPDAEPVSESPQLRPGDFVIGTENPFVVPVGSDDAVIDIPDSELRGPAVQQPVPSVAVANEGGISSGWTWLFWLGGAGLAMILGLFLFSRQLREYFGVVQAAVPDVPRRRADDPKPQSSIADIDYNFDATTIRGRKLSLDANLNDGTGLQEADEMDVAQDFAFSASESQVDMEITEAAAKEEERVPTEVIPPKMRMTDTIVEDEILPEGDDVVAAEVGDDEDQVEIEIEVTAEVEDDEDYSLSMNVDATKHILEDHTSTTKDLQAILVDTNEPSGEITGEYSTGRSAEYQILEQDYENELTATQALEKEIEDAARALAKQMDEVFDEDDTEGIPVPQDPDMTAELTADLRTQGDAENDAFAASGAIPDVMVEMPVADSDATLDVESPLIDDEKKEASSGS